MADQFPVGAESRFGPNIQHHLTLEQARASETTGGSLKTAGNTHSVITQSDSSQKTTRPFLVQSVRTGKRITADIGIIILEKSHSYITAFEPHFSNRQRPKSAMDLGGRSHHNRISTRRHSNRTFLTVNGPKVRWIGAVCPAMIAAACSPRVSVLCKQTTTHAGATTNEVASLGRWR